MVANSVALLFSTISKYSKIKNSAPKVDGLAYLITDQDTHKCQACGETGTLSPTLRKKCRDCPGDFKNPNFCIPCFKWGQGVPRWERGEYLLAHPRPSGRANSSQSNLHFTRAKLDVSSPAAATSLSAASTGHPSARASGLLFGCSD